MTFCAKHLFLGPLVICLVATFLDSSASSPDPCQGGDGFKNFGQPAHKSFFKLLNPFIAKNNNSSQDFHRDLSQLAKQFQDQYSGHKDLQIAAIGAAGSEEAYLISSAFGDEMWMHTNKHVRVKAFDNDAEGLSAISLSQRLRGLIDSRFGEEGRDFVKPISFYFHDCTQVIPGAPYDAVVIRHPNPKYGDINRKIFERAAEAVKSKGRFYISFYTGEERQAIVKMLPKHLVYWSFDTESALDGHWIVVETP